MEEAREAVAVEGSEAVAGIVEVEEATTIEEAMWGRQCGGVSLAGSLVESVWWS